MLARTLLDYESRHDTHGALSVADASVNIEKTRDGYVRENANVIRDPLGRFYTAKMPTSLQLESFLRGSGSMIWSWVPALRTDGAPCRIECGFVDGNDSLFVGVRYEIKDGEVSAFLVSSGTAALRLEAFPATNTRSTWFINIADTVIKVGAMEGKASAFSSLGTLEVKISPGSFYPVLRYVKTGSGTNKVFGRFYGLSFDDRPKHERPLRGPGFLRAVGFRGDVEDRFVLAAARPKPGTRHLIRLQSVSIASPKEDAFACIMVYEHEAIRFDSAMSWDVSDPTIDIMYLRKRDDRTAISPPITSTNRVLAHHVIGKHKPEDITASSRWTAGPVIVSLRFSSKATWYGSVHFQSSADGPDWVSSI